MTRRKQDAPKRLESLENSQRSVPSQHSGDSRLVVTDSGTEGGSGEDGETSSSEGPICAKHVDARSVLPCVLGSRLVGKQPAGRSHCPAHYTCNDDVSDSNLGELCVCHIHGSYLGCVSANCRSKIFGTKEQHSTDFSNLRFRSSSLTERCRSSKPLSDCGSCNSIRHKRCKENSVSSILPSAAPTSADTNPQMALVMASLPVGLVYSNQNSSNSMTPDVTSSSTQDQQDDQPLDLSRKSARSASFSSTETELVVLRNRSCSDSTASIPLRTNGFSSLQSLQRRFGDGVPLHPSHRLATMVIPLPANVTCKSAINPNGLWSTDDVPPSTDLVKSHPLPQVGLSEELCITEASAVPPVPQGESNRQASPVSEDESVGNGWSKHTTHRCSCQSTFSTLYSLSLHLQETGHTPSSSKGSSPMDYPKLVRGQDMWLNHESEQTRRILRCIQCGESFRSLPLLTVHMMQTQHYTTIVNSDHGRRQHKCSVYCGRELDQECIFKCKVCHGAFGDMGKLASHMVISGHHKKQLPRHAVNPVTVSGGVSATSRQRKRKRCFQEDNISTAVTARSFTVASLLNYRRKHNGINKSMVKDFHLDLEANGESNFPETMSAGLVICDICGETVATLCFNSHVQECLRQRAELMETLRNNLSLEEGHLSRSESKLLKPDFSLASATHQQSSTFTDRACTRTESAASKDQEAACIKDYQNREENFNHQTLDTSPERSCSLPSSDLTQMVRLSASPSAKLSASPSARFSTSPSARFSTSPSARFSTSPSAKLSASPSARFSTSPSARFSTSPSARFSTSPSARFGTSPSATFSTSPSATFSTSPSARYSTSPSATFSTSPSARFSTSPGFNDLREVPHKKWCSHHESSQEVKKESCETVMTKVDDNWPLNAKQLSISPTVNQKFDTCAEYTNIDQNTVNEEVPHKLKSQHCRVDDDRRDSEMDVKVHDLSKVEEHSGRLSPPNHVIESTLESSLDCTYSALYKLDLLSRGLKLSSPRRIISLESKLPIHQSPKVPKKRESLPTKIRSPMSKSSSCIRSPQAHTSSALPHLTSESPSPSKANMAFDIIDPNVDPRGTSSAPSALEAMESFINNSFSARPEICTPSLTSMFSPFRSCFPSPGSLLPSGGILLDTPNSTTSHFAKFSRFFGMVPGIPVYSEMASSHAMDKTKTNANVGSCWVDTTNPAAMLSLSEYHLRTLSDQIFALNKGTVAINTITSFPSVKDPFDRYKLELPADGTVCQDDNHSKESCLEMVSTFKKQNHQFDSSADELIAESNHTFGSSDSLTAHKNHKLDSSLDRLTEQNNHKFGNSPDHIIAEKNYTYGSSDYMLAQKNHKYVGSPDHLLAHTIGHDHYRTAGKISGNMEIPCTDGIASHLQLIESLHSSSQTVPHVQPLHSSSQTVPHVQSLHSSSSQTPPHVESLAVELERKRRKGPKLNREGVSSKGRDAQDGEIDMAVKIEHDEKDTMWKDHQVVTNDEKVTDVAEAARSKVDINYEKNQVSVQHGNSKVNTELENGKVNVELKENEVDMVIQNNKIYSQFEKNKLAFQTEVDRSEVNIEIEQNSSTVYTDDSKVDKSMIMKTESECSFDEGEQILDTTIINPNEHKSKANNFKLLLNIEQKMHIKLAVTESKRDEFKKNLNYETWLNSVDDKKEMYFSTNKCVIQQGVFVKDIQQEECKAVCPENICGDTQTRSLNDKFGKEHFHERNRLKSCSSYNPDLQHGNDLVKIPVSEMKCIVTEQEPLSGRSAALFSDTNFDNCNNVLLDENSCGVFDLRVEKDNKIDEQVDEVNKIDEQVDEVASDISWKNIHKEKCKEEVELNTENITDNQVTINENTSQNVHVVNINNMTNVGNNEHGTDHIECASLVNCCKNETQLEYIQSEDNVYSGNVQKPSTDVEHVDEGHGMNKSMSTHLNKAAGFDCEVVDSSFSENKSFIQSVKMLTNVKSEYTEEIVTLQNGMIREENQYIQKNLQKKTNQGSTTPIKSSKCLSESETNMTTNEIDRQKQRKSALDYLSSFVYNQPLSTEHPLDNLQRLLATNDLKGLPKDPEKHLVNTSHKCCSADVFASKKNISRSGQMCGTCSTEDNEDDESYLADSGMSEGDIREHRCVGCRRRFASKGSYRYHLSRCHLSSAKKYSIKETFSQSPYVYLPLDHTVKLSKYYQIKQKLLHEGK